MNFDLVALEARRTATLTALLGTLVVTLLALLQSTGAAEGPGALRDLGAADSRVDLTRVATAWKAGLMVLGGWCVLRSANLAQSWFGAGSVGEGSWLAPTVPSRFGIAGAAQLGIAVAGAALALCVASTIAWFSPPGNDGTLLEPFAVAGPTRSKLLLPGDRYEQTFGQLRPPAGATVRVRLTPAAGAGAPTTRVEVSAGTHSLVRPLARRSWVEVPLDEGVPAMSARNVGEGAAALLGPRPVEIWAPSNALLRGHGRLWLHACAWLTFLVGTALSAGLWMSPGISAAASLSLWLFLAATGFAPPWIPGTGDMGAALEALGNGRAPSLPGPWTWLVAVGATAAAALTAAPALRSWHHEDRA